MAHKTMVGGTAYEISGGKTLVDGTAYSIKNGKTLVGGTAYEIGFGSNIPIILEVEKMTYSTYAAETTYENEQFILLNIYPKTNGTVTVTYGGLTKTITDTSGFAEPNAQKVFFGTFNGVSDSVSTPSSGTLTIEGDYRAVGQGTFSTSSKITTEKCNCITAITDLGSVVLIPTNAFSNCAKIVSVVIPNSVTTINDYAFENCDALTSVVIPNSVTTINGYAFNGCDALTSVVIPESVTYIGSLALALNYSAHNIYFRFLATTPPVIEDMALGLPQNYWYEITVPAGCGAAYKAAEYWSDYADRIVEAS